MHCGDERLSRSGEAGGDDIIEFCSKIFVTKTQVPGVHQWFRVNGKKILFYYEFFNGVFLIAVFFPYYYFFLLLFLSSVQLKKYMRTYYENLYRNLIYYMYGRASANVYFFSFTRRAPRQFHQFLSSVIYNVQPSWWWTPKLVPTICNPWLRVYILRANVIIYYCDEYHVCALCICMRVWNHILTYFSRVEII